MVFHKDGFTDLRGRFDYASLNTGLDGIDSFAILVLSDKEGALVIEAKPPTGEGKSPSPATVIDDSRL